MTKTFVLLKPDAIERGLAGEIIRRFEEAGFQILAAKSLVVDIELAREHYAEHTDKDFYPELEAFISRSMSMAMILGGSPDIVSEVRLIMGATNPKEAEAGTIRGDLAEKVTENLVHGSDSPESAEREISLFFGSWTLTE